MIMQYPLMLRLTVSITAVAEFETLSCPTTEN